MIEPEHASHFKGVRDDPNAIPPLDLGDPQNIANRKIEKILPDAANQIKNEEAKSAQQAQLVRPRPIVNHRAALDSNQYRV